MFEKKQGKKGFVQKVASEIYSVGIIFFRDCQNFCKIPKLLVVKLFFDVFFFIFKSKSL